MQNKQLAEELHKATIRKFEKRKVQYFFFLLCVIDIYSEYAWVIPLKDITITNSFQKNIRLII